MLVMSPEARRLMRKERQRERDTLRGRLGQERHSSIVTGLARIMRTKFAEGHPRGASAMAPRRGGVAVGGCADGRDAPAFDLRRS